MNKYYLTSAIPYVNAKPHIGHALEFIQADAIRRYKIMLGKDVTYLCGSDENAIKNIQAAENENKPIQEFIDENAKAFEHLATELNVKFDVFQKGSDQKHHTASQKLWELCDESGDIYKKSYKGLYCVGCEEFKTHDQLVNNECPEHIGKKLEEIEEENYFFKLSKYQEQILKLIESDEYQIIPGFRKNEIVSFIKSGLNDFSISRSNKRAKAWGVPVPGDPTQKIYVWFDALNIYQSGIGFGSTNQNEIDNYQKLWPADLHVVGKGIIRFHAVYWPAILMSAGLKLPKKLLVHEYFTVNGQKMSKSLGNVVDPIDMIDIYGTDALRYYCLGKISPFQDGDFSEEKLKEAYNSDLANGLGNLIARVAKLAEKNNFKTQDLDLTLSKDTISFLESFEFNKALEYIWIRIQKLNQYINDVEPWKLTEKKEINNFLKYATGEILLIATDLKPFLPYTSERILNIFNGEIKSETPLFPRVN